MCVCVCACAYARMYTSMCAWVRGCVCMHAVWVSQIMFLNTGNC